MTRESPPHDKPLGLSADFRRGAWVQTERRGHEAWATLAVRSPRAAALMHIFVSRMGDRNAVVIPQKLLAKMLNSHERTVQRAIADLAHDKWIQVVRLNGPGTVCAYVVNDRVAWGQPRDELCLSTFSATVVADICEQTDTALEMGELRKIPMLYAGQRQLPMSEDSYESLASIDLPAISRKSE